jgi:hypothetical protein
MRWFSEYPENSCQSSEREKSGKIQTFLGHYTSPDNDYGMATDSNLISIIHYLLSPYPIHSMP